MRVALGFFLLFLLPALAPVHAQDRCGTVQYSRTLHPDAPERKMRFEAWMSNLRLKRVAPHARRQADTYQIPVVVHVIHNGESIGDGANISDEQILSQLKVLNEDFNRGNSDAINTPPEFAAVAGSLNVEFVLAKQDPQGFGTTGIVRVDGGRNGWTMADNYALKQVSYWPAEQYMNIWVCNLVDTYLGYAQHPESDLPGMENSSTNRLTDGVVIWHRAFGSADHGNFPLDPTFNKGRTATHEIGHFLGLNHIWGDESGCNGSDYVDDTPNQGSPTFGCPDHPRGDSCSDIIMFQNFLDYTNDACMNLFTQGQVERMSIVLENSPRRHSLLSSPGLLAPAPLPNDLGVQAILFPDANICDHNVTPVITVRNYGNNEITSGRIRFSLDGTVRETLDFPLSLAPQESTEVSFSPLTLSAGSHDLAFQVLLTNGTTDQGSYNDLQTSTVVVPAFAPVPLTVNFETPPDDWVIHNPDGQITWEVVPLPAQNPPDAALKLDLFNYDNKVGEIDVFLSPILDLSDVPAATLTFEVAHARYQASNDRLRIVAVADCQNVLDGEILYDKAGADLATTSSRTSSFTPNASHWRKEVVDLAPYIGQERFQIAFVGINGWGNNIYLNNIALVTELNVDASLAGLAAPSPVSCSGDVTPRLRIQNNGTVCIEQLAMVYRVNNGPGQTHLVDNADIAIGATAEIPLPPVVLDRGRHVIDVLLTEVNGLADDNPVDNERTFAVVVNNREERIPLRENFEGSFGSNWTTVNPTATSNWERVDLGNNTAMAYRAYGHPVPDEEAWLVSPVLDFSRVSTASLVFDFSHRQRNGQREDLLVLISRNCGLTYEPLDFTPPQTGGFEDEWIPQNDDDWVRNLVLDLSSLAGEKSARVAFVVRNQNGNNLYLDNFEFFVTSNPDLIEINEPFSVYGYNPENMPASDLRITFNLERRQDVRYSLLNATGQMETDGILVDVLNQTYPLNLSGRLTPGVYFIRVQIDGRLHTRKVLVY